MTMAWSWSRRRILPRIVETARDIAAREGAQAARLLKGELLRTQLDLDSYVCEAQLPIRITPSGTT